ncbi:ribonuclease Oy-like [Cotesia glomerata]|nr:ribonuclease Oy-like [Cotesia glomerata]
MERSISLRIPKHKTPHFIRGGSVGSNLSPRSSPGTSWSSLTSSSGLGRSPSLSQSPSGSFSSMNSSLSSPGLGRTRKLSDLPLIPDASVAVNDQTCKEDSSPAEQCFNFFTFSIFWPPALGYQYLSKNKPVNDNINRLKWSIHGLWPSSYTGAVPENCKKRKSVSFNQHRFQREKGLRTSLENKWFNICSYKQHGCSMTNFWDREFSKHGTCASRSSLISSDLGYFKMAVNMMDRVNVAGIFINSGFKVGDKLTYGEIVDIVNDTIGIRARVEVFENKAKNENYLKEIRVCYNLQLHPINCPETKLLTQEIRNREIIYLDHVPKLD